jgi:hypothetical protein
VERRRHFRSHYGHRIIKEWCWQSESGADLNETAEMLASVAMQIMAGDYVTLADQKIRVKRIGSGRLRMVQFRLNGRMLEAIEQNPEKPSRWGEKHHVVQFMDAETHKYVAVSVDGKIREYAHMGEDY